jgi:hypothetical protein
MRYLLLIFAVICLNQVCGLWANADDDTSPLKMRARYEIEPKSRAGQIVVECEIPEGHHIYSMDQSSPPGPTKIQIAKSDQFDLTASFTANRMPDVIEHDPVFETRLEQFSDKVTFTIPLQLTPDVDPQKVAVTLIVNCQVCSEDGCVLIRNKKLDAIFGGFVDTKALRKNVPEAKKSVIPPTKTNNAAATYRR